MASRKTYFGIGWQDPTDLDGGTPAKTDAEDRSAPTVVDEEKVAEELKRLRSWYQGDEQQGGSPINPPPAAPSALNPVGAQSRPTAVGHATGPPAATQPRPMAPDPMRATMYGHDVHQFDLDMPPTSQTPPAGNAPLISSAPTPVSTPSVSKALVPSSEAARWRQEDSYRSADTGADARSPSGSFPIARHPQGEAEQLHRPGGPRRSWHDAEARPTARTPIGPRIMFAVGLAALTAALLIWLQSDAEPDVPAVAAPPARTSTDLAPTVPPPIPAPAAASVQPAVPVAMPDQPAPRAAASPNAAAPERAIAPATMRAPAPATIRGPAPPLGAPKPPAAVAPIGQRQAATPAPRPQRRAHEAKVNSAKWNGDGDAAEQTTTSDTGTRKSPSDPSPRKGASDTGPHRNTDLLGPDSDGTLPPSEE